MTLRVLEPGLYTLVVDFGRPHHRSLGVPIGGAADRTSLALGNALVGNPPDAAALEINLAGPTLEAVHDLACVVYGAPFRLNSDRQPLSEGRTFTFHAGERIHMENSYKYDLEELSELAAAGGFELERTWLDQDKRFSSNLLLAV